VTLSSRREEIRGFVWEGGNRGLDLFAVSLFPSVNVRKRQLFNASPSEPLSTLKCTPTRKKGKPVKSKTLDQADQERHHSAWLELEKERDEKAKEIGQAHAAGLAGDAAFRIEWNESGQRHSIKRFNECLEIGAALSAVKNSYQYDKDPKLAYGQWLSRNEKVLGFHEDERRYRSLFKRESEIQKDLDTLGVEPPNNTEGNRVLRIFDLKAWSGGRIFESDRSEGEKAKAIPRAPSNMTSIKAAFKNAGFTCRELYTTQPAEAPYDTSVRMQGPNLYLHGRGMIACVFVKNPGDATEPLKHRGLTDEEKRFEECTASFYVVTHGDEVEAAIKELFPE
jgi:hypothetical protein